MNGKPQKVNGDITKVSYVPGLSEAAVVQWCEEETIIFKHAVEAKGQGWSPRRQLSHVRRGF